jgi:hypothetical protein
LLSVEILRWPRLAVVLLLVAPALAMLSALPRWDPNPLAAATFRMRRERAEDALGPKGFFQRLTGNTRIALCERGIRTFERYTRNTTDINAIPVIKQMSHLPVVLDPSHGTGKWEYVTAVAKAGIAAGADGLIIEVHPRPEEAASDGAQSLKPEKFAQLVGEIRRVAEAAVDGIEAREELISCRRERAFRELGAGRGGGHAADGGHGDGGRPR